MFATNDNSEQHPHIVMLQQQQLHAAQMQELQMLEMKNAMEGFLDGLTADQCISLCRMLQAIQAHPAYLSIVAGQLIAILRLVHKVCATCGDTKHSTMEHIAATEGDASSGPIDYGYLAGLTETEVLKKLNVQKSIPDESNGIPEGAYECRNCDIVYVTLFDRAGAGKECPNCKMNQAYLRDKPDSELELGDLMTRYGVAESYVNENGVFCLGCGTEFPVLKHRITQGKECPVCTVQLEVKEDEGPSGTP